MFLFHLLNLQVSGIKILQPLRCECSSGPFPCSAMFSAVSQSLTSFLSCNIIEITIIPEDSMEAKNSLLFLLFKQAASEFPLTLGFSVYINYASSDGDSKLERLCRTRWLTTGELQHSLPLTTLAGMRCFVVCFSRNSSSNPRRLNLQAYSPVFLTISALKFSDPASTLIVPFVEQDALAYYASAQEAKLCSMSVVTAPESSKPKSDVEQAATATTVQREPFYKHADALAQMLLLGCEDERRCRILLDDTNGNFELAVSMYW